MPYLPQRFGVIRPPDEEGDYAPPSQPMRPLPSPAMAPMNPGNPRIQNALSSFQQAQTGQNLATNLAKINPMGIGASNGEYDPKSYSSRTGADGYTPPPTLRTMTPGGGYSLTSSNPASVIAHDLPYRQAERDAYTATQGAKADIQSGNFFQNRQLATDANARQNRITGAESGYLDARTNNLNAITPAEVTAKNAWSAGQQTAQGRDLLNQAQAGALDPTARNALLQAQADHLAAGDTDAAQQYDQAFAYLQEHPEHADAVLGMLAALHGAKTLPAKGKPTPPPIDPDEMVSQGMLPYQNSTSRGMEYRMPSIADQPADYSQRIEAAKARRKDATERTALNRFANPRNLMPMMLGR